VLFIASVDQRCDIFLYILFYQRVNSIHHFFLTAVLALQVGSNVVALVQTAEKAEIRLPVSQVARFDCVEDLDR